METIHLNRSLVGKSWSLQRAACRDADAVLVAAGDVEDVTCAACLLAELARVDRRTRQIHLIGAVVCAVLVLAMVALHVLQ